VTRKKLAARKQPRQERSVATVDAILQAATYILTKRGWAAFTTNAVAEKAGVNIASLYQYFPNKDAIIAELQRHHIEELRSRLPEPRAARSPEDHLRVMLETVVMEHRVNPALHRVFAEELPRTLRSGTRPREAEDHWAKQLAPLVTNVPDAALAAFIVGVTSHAVIHEAATDRPDLLEHPLFISELVRLLTAYISGK
jgi:AcrR family transcriptional regulator